MWLAWELPVEFVAALESSVPLWFYQRELAAECCCGSVASIDACCCEKRFEEGEVVVKRKREKGDNDSTFAVEKITSF